MPRASLLLSFAFVIAILPSTIQAAPEKGSSPPSAVRFRPFHRQIGDLFGLNTSLARRYPGLVRPSLYRLRPLRVDWVREEFTADALHKEAKAPYNFRKYDHVINLEVRAHLKVLGLLDFNNTFDGKPHNFMPHKDMDRLTTDYDDYVAAVVTHFRTRIVYWQIWNEPDIHTFWSPRPNPADYANLLTRSYETIKALDPSAQVVIGGPSGSDPHGIRFLHQVAADGGRFDILADQPYTTSPGFDFVSALKALKSFRKPIWITEMGWAGGPHCTQFCGSQAGQGERLAVAYLQAAVHGISRMFWYDFRDEGQGVNFADHFGLLSWNLAAKRSYLAYELSDYFLRYRRITGVSYPEPGVVIWRIGMGRTTSYAVFNTSKRNGRVVRLAWHLGPVRALNYRGTLSGASKSGRLTFWLGAMKLHYLVPDASRIPSFQPHGLGHAGRRRGHGGHHR